jgi:hypothetical protein
MQQVADWLERLGLSQYARCFAENDISFVILPDLIDHDLEKIGVASLGRRRLLLRSIAELKIVDKTTLAPDAAASAPPPAAKTGMAERRQVTVMFSDLVGSTALSARMDPEDLREVITAYQKCAADTVGRFGGYLAKYMGDGVLVYFGYPQAHEDDAERAVRAGLELVSACGWPRHPRAPSDARRHRSGRGGRRRSNRFRRFSGSRPSLARRRTLRRASRVLRSRTAWLLRRVPANSWAGSSSFRTLGFRNSRASRGKCVPGPRYDHLQWKAASRPCTQAALQSLSGGKKNLICCFGAGRRQRAEGQVALLFGEPGIGKSRLTAALTERLAGGPHTRLRYFCSPQHTDSAFYPIIGQMERAAGFMSDDTSQVKLDKLDAVLMQSYTAREDAALFAEMLSLTNDGRYPELELSPQQRRQKTLEALSAQPETLSRTNPVLMIFEDVHWIDPTSLEADDQRRLVSESRWPFAYQKPTCALLARS